MSVGLFGRVSFRRLRSVSPSARRNAVVVAPNHDGIREQIDHDRTGLLNDATTPNALTNGLIQAIELSDDKRHRMLAAADRRVRRERDVITNLSQTLHVMWTAPPCIR